VAGLASGEINQDGDSHQRDVIAFTVPDCFERAAAEEGSDCVQQRCAIAVTGIVMQAMRDDPSYRCA
jgi:hypothetical protein